MAEKRQERMAIVCANCGEDMHVEPDHAGEGECALKIYPCTNCEPDMRHALKCLLRDVLAELAEELG